MSSRPKTLVYQRGLTLLELLVAIAIFVTVGALATLFLSQSLNSSKRLETANEALMQVQTGLTLLEKDLNAMLLRSYRDESGNHQVPLALNPQQGYWLMQWIRGGDLGQASQLLRYRLDQGQLLRERTARVDGVSEQQWQGYAIIDAVDNIGAEFFYDDDWHTQLQQDKSGLGRIYYPQAIRITLQHQMLGELQKIVLLPRL